MQGQVGEFNELVTKQLLNFCNQDNPLPKQILMVILFQVLTLGWSLTNTANWIYHDLLVTINHICLQLQGKNNLMVLQMYVYNY